MDRLIEAQQDWDDFAADYYAGEQASQVPYVSAVIAYLQKQHLLPRHQQQLLDLGGGTGRFAVPLAKLGVQVEVADFSAAMLAILQQRRLELAQPERLTFRQTSWQALVQSGQKFSVVFMSMLPAVQPADLAAISQLTTAQFLIFRLVSVRDDFFTPLFHDLDLPPERPEADQDLLTAYQNQHLSDFTAWQAHDFNFSTSESLTAREATDYLATYPGMTTDKMATTRQRLQTVLVNQKLTVTEHYRFRLLNTRRISQ